MPKDQKPAPDTPDERPDETPAEPADAAETPEEASQTPPAEPEEIGGPAGPEPTRFGDWERKGRCIDF